MEGSSVAGHYARSDLVAAIQAGMVALGKTEATVTAEDLSAVDQFHIGGTRATADLFDALKLTPQDHLLDVGCGLGGPARQAAERHRCRVSGIDLTADYVEAGNTISRWLKCDDRVTLRQGDALAMPFPDATFSAATLIHVGMNIADKARLFAEIARVLRPGGRLGIYDVMLCGTGELAFPVPWATTSATDAIASPADYREALVAAGLVLEAERNRRDLAEAFFARMQAQGADPAGPPPISLHILMGENRQAKVANMQKNIASGLIAPVEMIARKP